MAWQTKTLAELIESITNDLVTRTQDTTARIRFSLPWILARVLAGVAYDIQGFATYIAKQIIPKTATDEYLDDWASVWGLNRKPATTARGFTIVTGNIGDTLPGGLVLLAEDQTEFTTDMAVYFSSSNMAVPVTASVAGSKGNMAGSTLLILSSPPAGFQAETYLLGANGMTGGGVGTRAIGFATVYATSGSTVPAGTILERLDGVQYTTDADVTFASTGYRAIPITAVLTGSSGNCPQGTYLHFPTPPAGVNEDAVVTIGGTTGGADEESDSELRSRLLNYIQEPPHGGTLADYETWMEDTPKVAVLKSWAFGYPTLASPAVDGYFVIEGTGAGIIPSTAEITLVQDYVDEKKPVTAIFTARAPTAHSVDLRIPSLQVLSGYSVSEVRTNIRNAINTLFLNHELSSATSYVKNSHLRDAISDAEGVDWFTLTEVDGGGPGSGLQDITLAAYELPILGAITWA